MTKSPISASATKPPAAPNPARVAAAPAVDQVDASYLESLLGYNARRAALAVIEVFLQRMVPYELRPVDFSVLSLIAHNPGITSRQLCSTLGILPPNLVGIINTMERREIVMRRPHPHDGRAVGLHLSAKGRKLMRDAERTAADLEAEVATSLSAGESKALISLLKKLYQTQHDDAARAPRRVSANHR
jgi:DNA-binding MarR family transcriptional regulator